MKPEKINRPPSGEPWIWLPRRLLASDAWRTMGIHGHRLVTFLLIEHMRHSGHKNGELLAPRRQLAEFGIRTHSISAAIDDATGRGLIDLRRGTGRKPSVYRLTWLPGCDGSAPSNRWETFSAPGNLGTKSQIMSAKQHSQGSATVALTKPVASAKQHSQGPVSSSAKQHSPSREDSYQDSDSSQFYQHGRAASATGPAPLLRAVQ